MTPEAGRLPKRFAPNRLTRLLMSADPGQEREVG